MFVNVNIIVQLVYTFTVYGMLSNCSCLGGENTNTHKEKKKLLCACSNPAIRVGNFQRGPLAFLPLVLLYYFKLYKFHSYTPTSVVMFRVFGLSVEDVEPPFFPTQPEGLDSLGIRNKINKKGWLG